MEGDVGLIKSSTEDNHQYCWVYDGRTGNLKINNLMILCDSIICMRVMNVRRMNVKTVEVIYVGEWMAKTMKMCE